MANEHYSDLMKLFEGKNNIKLVSFFLDNPYVWASNKKLCGYFDRKHNPHAYRNNLRILYNANIVDRKLMKESTKASSQSAFYKLNIGSDVVKNLKDFVTSLDLD